MKDQETDYLDKLFAKSSDEVGETETDFPLVDVPSGLTNRLYAITEPKLSSVPSIKERMFDAWPKVTSIAASLLMAVVVFQMYQQQQTLKQLERSQADLATALHYLGEANKITRVHMMNSLNSNMKKATYAPVVEIGRDAVRQSVKSVESATKRPSRSL